MSNILNQTRRDRDFNEEETIDLPFIIASITSTINFCVMAVDIYLITMISKKDRHKTRTKIYIMHYTVSNMLSILIPLMFSIVSQLTELSRYFGAGGYCTVLKLEASCTSICHLIVVGLGMNWILEKFEGKAKKMHKYFVLSIYTVGFSLALIQIVLCFSQSKVDKYISDSVVYSLALMFVMCCNYLEHKKLMKNVNSYTLIAANVMVLSWLPKYVYKLLWSISNRVDSYIFAQILLITSCIPNWLAYGCPIIILFILVKMDKHFRLDHSNLFRKNTKTDKPGGTAVSKKEEIESVEYFAEKVIYV